MNIFDAIRTRRSIGKVKPDPINRETVEKLLEMAVWAPNHFHTEPWNFFVLTGEGRRPLARTLAQIAQEDMDDPSSEENQIIFNKQEKKPFRAPLIIAIAVTPSDNPKAVLVEEKAAVNAAIQNLLLAAHALGLGAIWRSGLPTYHPKMNELFGLKGEHDQVLGFVYIGYPDMKQPKGRKRSFEHRTTWIEQDQSYF